MAQTPLPRGLHMQISVECWGSRVTSPSPQCEEGCFVETPTSLPKAFPTPGVRRVERALSAPKMSYPRHRIGVKGGAIMSLPEGVGTGWWR